MTNIAPPPIQEPVIEQDGLASVPWMLFFNNMFTGDTGTEWTPEFTGLTESGGPATISGRYYKLGSNVVFISVAITPADGGSTTATAGITAITNFPLPFASNGIAAAVSGVAPIGLGAASVSDNRIYAPTWTTVGDTVTLLAIVEVL